MLDSWRAAFLIALVACGPAQQAERALEAALPPADERGAIYSVLLDSMRHHAPGAPLRHRYVQVETVPSSARSRDDYLLREVPEVTPELLAAFRAADSRPADVRALVRREDVEWITRDSLAEVMRAATTPRLPMAADFSTTAFSSVGMSVDGRMALVYVSYWCGGLCADQHWALLERQPNGRWSLRRTLLTLIS